MRAFAGSFALLIAASSVSAEGFAVRDLSGVAAEATAALGAGFQHRAEQRRLTLLCPSCEGGPMIDVLLGRQADGTEQRVRSGETSIASLERLCKAKSPECRLSGLEVAPAIGWVTTYPLAGAMTGSTAVILRDGDLLTIRSVASEAGVAKRNAEKLVKTLAPKIVGR